MPKAMTAEQKLEYMTHTPLPRLILTLSVPTVISMLITAFYNMADTYFVGLIGSASASGAVGVVFPLMAITQAVGFMFGHGSGNHMSRVLGAGDAEDAKRMAATGFFTAFLVGMAIMLVGLLASEPLVYLLGSTETIAPYAQDYIRYLMPGVPFLISSLVLNNQLRFQGSAFYGMIGITSGALLNVALDPVFIFVLDMGVAGAALATSLSLAAGGYGDAAIAAMSIVTRVMMMTISAIIGFGQGFQPVCGFNYGAKLYGRVRDAFWFCVKVCFGVLVGLGIIAVFFAPKIVGLFLSGNAEVQRIGTLALRLQCIFLPLFSFTCMANMMLQTMGIAGRATLLAMSRQGLFFIPTVLAFEKIFGLLGVQMAQPMADVLSFLLAIPLALGVLRELKNKEAQCAEQY